MSLRRIFGNLVIAPLELIASPPPDLCNLLERSAIRLLSSELIVAEGDRPFEMPIRERSSSKIIDDRVLELIEAVVARIGAEGLAPHFHRLVRLLAAVHLDSAAAVQWVALEKQQPYSFLMTDSGGPAIANWQSYCFDKNGRRYLRVNKISAINGTTFRVASVAARRGQSPLPIPVTIWLSPADCEQLDKVPAGRPFLDGAVQLGNVTGVVEISTTCQLTAPVALAWKLDVARTHLVRALMQYVSWLVAQRRVVLDSRGATALQYLNAIATMIAQGKIYTSHTALQVKALKFASNELLAEIVAEGRAANPADQRDLLGFSKMEGSSYFCLMQLYGRLLPQGRGECSAAAAHVRGGVL